MSEVSFEQLLNEEGSLNQIRTGAVVKGTVIGVKENEISLNIGYKADGIVTKNEYTNDSSADLTQLVHVGDEMEVKVLKVNDGEGQVALILQETGCRIAAARCWKRHLRTRPYLKAKVAQVLNGGLSVLVDGIRVFIPASLVSDGYERDLTKYAGSGDRVRYHQSSIRAETPHHRRPQADPGRAQGSYAEGADGAHPGRHDR